MSREIFEDGESLLRRMYIRNITDILELGETVAQLKSSRGMVNYVN